MIDIFKNISKAISTTPETSLHSYIQYARPPPMPLSSTAPKPPPSAHKSHKNHLQVEPNPRRKLQNMHLLHGEFLSERVRQFTDQHVPKDTDSFLEDSDIETGVRLSIPCAPFDIQLQNLGRVVDVESTHKWVKYYPLQTLQRAVHLAFPESADYRFTDFRGPDLDEDIMRWSTWTCHNSPSAYNTPAVVFVQPPWILSLADFESFIRCPSVYSFKGTFASDERLWAKIWDVCFQRKSCFFIVTTYWGWVLGAFSKAWSNGFVTRIHDFSESQPTILESLLYWIASAMGIEGSWQVPEVSNEPAFIQIESPCLVRDIMPPGSWEADRRALLALSVLT
ncbi:hypothetical protein OBBRIDRAFT_720196 [Obba rivulosa]|uniref:Uncharacterized protein n=1 Tax=Obba rivulosa TaxID=1052685 RepID=A0A8E2DTT6_9APHY|nr:hypothetical protein OBBRIDRAFT_720196 [Obba rivulosa]